MNIDGDDDFFETGTDDGTNDDEEDGDDTDGMSEGLNFFTVGNIVGE
jgi:hypothetical protein